MIQFNVLLIAFLTVFVFQSLFQVAMNLINIRHLRRQKNHVPRVFQGTVNTEKFSKIIAYTADSTRFGIVEKLFDQALLLVILLTGFLPWFVEIITTWHYALLVEGWSFLPSLQRFPICLIFHLNSTVPL